MITIKVIELKQCKSLRDKMNSIYSYLYFVLIFHDFNLNVLYTFRTDMHTAKNVALRLSFKNLAEQSKAVNLEIK